MTKTSPDATRPLIDFRQARFVQSAQNLSQCPGNIQGEIAFAGRSNAGKSSAINRLTGQKKLARTSKTPGRTQLINFFSLGQSQALVDLPGYGFAKVPDAVKLKWQEDLTEYLNERDCLKGCVLVMDVRHPLREFDCHFIGWAVASKLPIHLLLTKSDKLKRGPAKSTLLSVMREAREQLAAADVLTADTVISAQLFSALKGLGVDELQATLSGWLEND